MGDGVGDVGDGVVGDGVGDVGDGVVGDGVGDVGGAGVVGDGDGDVGDGVVIVVYLVARVVKGWRLPWWCWCRSCASCG